MSNTPGIATFERKGALEPLCLATTANHRRLLIVDDNPAIHEDFRRIFASEVFDDELARLEATVFGASNLPPAREPFELHFASQGKDAFELVLTAHHEERPFSLIFMDVRMPPGWNGIETTKKILAAEPDVQIVICSAYSDHSINDISDAIGRTDRVLILKKPFDVIEVEQAAEALCTKYQLAREAQLQLGELEARVASRTKDLSEINTQLREEMSARSSVEAQLRMAQKLEAVGQLAAGIAHEINTPIQFVSDTVHFLRDAFQDLTGLVETYRQSFANASACADLATLSSTIEEAEEEADLEFIFEEVPGAFERAFEGVDRVAKIVSAMKEFAHPDQRAMTSADINRGIKNTLVVARNEYKFVADVQTDFAELPPVICHPGDLNQVFLNLIVNAAHAISDNPNRKPDERGNIKVSTTFDDGFVSVSISDTGGGIPPELAARIFEPFFTTKEVGRGTGQGLAIAHAIIVEKHGGKIWFETAPGEGTTFFIRLSAESEEQSP